MAVQCSLSLYLLALLARNAISIPTHQNSTMAPVHEVRDVNLLAQRFSGFSDVLEIICHNDNVCTESIYGPGSQCIGRHCQCKLDVPLSTISIQCMIKAMQSSILCQRRICQCFTAYQSQYNVCLKKLDPSGAASISPYFATIVSIMVARIAAS